MTSGNSGNNSYTSVKNMALDVTQWILFFILLVIAISAAFGTDSAFVFIFMIPALFFIMPLSGRILGRKYPKFRLFRIRLILAITFLIIGVAVIIIIGFPYRITFYNKPGKTVFSSPITIRGYVSGDRPILAVNDRIIELENKKFTYTHNLARGENSITFALYEKVKEGTEQVKKDSKQFLVIYTDKELYELELNRLHRIELIKARYGIILPRDISIKELGKREKLVQRILEAERKYNVQLDKNMDEKELIIKEKGLKLK